MRHEILSPAQLPKVPRTSGYLDFWLENKWIYIYIYIYVDNWWEFVRSEVPRTFGSLQFRPSARKWVYTYSLSDKRGPHSRVKKGEGSGVAWKLLGYLWPQH
jgi:hypothetical protein